MKIAVVVPTVREDCYQTFLKKWARLFKKHSVELITVRDGDEPVILNRLYDLSEFSGAIFNKSDCCRNLGFAYISKYLPEVTHIITLDDDTEPSGDTIADHIKVLDQRFPLSWMSTADKYMRGVPYAVRNESECVVSHGVWQGVKDWDAPSQLVNGNPDVVFYKGAIPRGIYFPLCGMNVAFKRKMLQYMYYAPMGYRVGLDRFADIWLGIKLKRVCDENDWAIATGYATVTHNRASNVWKNLQKEARGLELNEGFWMGKVDDPYFDTYKKSYNLWRKLIRQYETSHCYRINHQN